MWKNPIFQERKKNVKKPYFSGGEKKKKFENFLSWNIKYFFFNTKKISSPEILSVFFFVPEKIFGRKILSIWKISCTKKSRFFQECLPTSWLFLPKKKKKNFFFFGAPKFLKSLRRTYQVIKESPLRRLS